MNFSERLRDQFLDGSIPLCEFVVLEPDEWDYYYPNSPATVAIADGYIVGAKPLSNSGDASAREWAAQKSKAGFEIWEGIYTDGMFWVTGNPESLAQRSA